MLAVLGILVGVSFIVGSLSWPSDRSSTGLFFIGVGLTVLGIAAFFVARWMAKRNL